TYLVMDFVKGESLADRIERQGALPEREVLVWAGQLLDALEYCHAQGIIHRDVKPQNVIITPEGEAVLVDFGLVKLWNPHDLRTKTAMRGMGTPEYAPPEQYSTQTGHTGPYSDLYSLGATLYHALTGQTPLTATDRMSDPDQFVAVRGWNRRVSPQTDAAVLRSLELPRSKRFQSAQEMAAALSGEAHASDHLITSKRHSTKVMQQTSPVARPRRSVPIWVWVFLGGNWGDIDSGDSVGAGASEACHAPIGKSYPDRSVDIRSWTNRKYTARHYTSSYYYGTNRIPHKHGRA
ncbi:MAG: serine/threonine-protein kinase, partial [Chloroflexota bacterium]|nr:serine/threonine-protein kinase [Chloroflexota bacterium]